MLFLGTKLGTWHIQECKLLAKPVETSDEVEISLILERFGQVNTFRVPPKNQNCVVFPKTSDTSGVLRWSMCDCFGA